MKIPIKCPSCEASLRVTKLSCSNCSTEITGDYQMPLFLQLSVEDQNFIMDFFLSSGSIKEIAKQASLSYPTMRNRMDDLIEKIKKFQTEYSE